MSAEKDLPTLRRKKPSPGSALAVMGGQARQPCLPQGAKAAWRVRAA